MSAKELSQSVESVKNQLASYGNQIQQYLSSVDAKVENYKFVVEKTANGLSIDCQFKAILTSTDNR